MMLRNLFFQSLLLVGFAASSTAAHGATSWGDAVRGDAVRGDASVNHHPSTVPVAANLQAQCKVSAILARRDGDGSIPKNLKHIEAQLGSDQFAAFKSFKLLEARKLSVSSEKVASQAMKTGHSVSMKLLGAGKGRLKLHAKLTSKSGGSALFDADYSIDNGGVLLVVAGSQDGGRVIFALQCRK